MMSSITKRFAPTAIAGSVCLLAPTAFAQEEEAAEPAVEEEVEMTAESTDMMPMPAESTGPETYFSVTLNQDTFFGFYPTAQFGVSLSDMVDLTAYTIIWTIPAFGAGGAGQNLWTEWGFGANFNLLDGNLSLNPQLGLLNGNLLSGADRGLALEGIVPNLTANYGDGLFEAQVYAGFYLALRQTELETEAGTVDSTQSDFLHYWVNAGIAPTDWASVGVHLEQLFATRADENANAYTWIGPYVQTSTGNAFLRFTAGVDIADASDDRGGVIKDFYKLNTGFSF